MPTGLSTNTLTINPTASITARFHRVGERTHLADGAWNAPLKIAKTFSREDGGLHLCSMDCSPGMLDGDRYLLDWQLDAGAQVSLTNQSFTRVHPARHDGCSLTQRIKIGPGARLELFPEPVMLFSAAKLTTVTNIEIEVGGSLIFSEILCAGRVRRGEAFAFEEYTGKLNVRYDGRLAFVSQVQFSPQSSLLQKPGAWGDYTHWGMFGAFGESNVSTLRETLHEVLQLHPMVLCGVSLVRHHGVTVSMLARRAQDLQKLVNELRSAAQPFSLHKLPDTVTTMAPCSLLSTNPQPFA